MQIEGAFRFSVDAENRLQVGQRMAQPRELGKLLPVGDDGAGAAVLQPELERLLAEKREEGDGDHSRLPGRGVCDGGLVTLREQDGDAIAPPKSARDQYVRQPVGEGGDGVEGQLARLAGRLDLDERQRASMAIGDVGAHVEAFGNQPAEVDHQKTCGLASAASGLT